MSLIISRCPTCGAEANRLYKQYWKICQELGVTDQQLRFYADLGGKPSGEPTAQARALNALNITKQCCRRTMMCSEQSTHIWGGSKMPPPLVE